MQQQMQETVTGNARLRCCRVASAVSTPAARLPTVTVRLGTQEALTLTSERIHSAILITRVYKTNHSSSKNVIKHMSGVILDQAKHHLDGISFGRNYKP